MEYPKAQFNIRTPLTGVENEREIILVLNELAQLGWNSHQWSTDKPDFTTEDVIKAFPQYSSLNHIEQEKLWEDYLDNLPDTFFIESFGKMHHGYIRSDQDTLLACAKDILAKAQKKANCLPHEWKYTHSNGHKTCKNCYTFAPCSVEEAKANYEAGHVELDAHKVLYFNRNNAICSCGSHEIYYLKDSMFFDTRYKCVSCHQFLPARYDNSHSHFSNVLSPSDPNFLTGDLAPTKRLHYNPQKIVRMGVATLPFLESQIIRYVMKMIQHYTFVSEQDPNDLEQMTSWLAPYVRACIQQGKFQIKKDDQRFDVTDIHLTSLSPVSYSLSIQPAENKQATFEEILTVIANSLDKHQSKNNE